MIAQIETGLTIVDKAASSDRWLFLASIVITLGGERDASRGLGGWIGYGG